MDSVACETLFFSFVTFLASRRKSRNNTNASTNYVGSNVLGRKFLSLFFGFLGKFTYTKIVVQSLNFKNAVLK